MAVFFLMLLKKHYKKIYLKKSQLIIINKFINIKLLLNNLSLEKNMSYYNFFLENTNLILHSNIEKYYMGIFWFSKYMSFYFFNFLGIKLKLSNLNLNINNSSKELLALWHNTYSDNFLKAYHFTPWQYLIFLIKLIYNKSFDNLILIVKTFITKSHLKYHKRLFYHFANIINTYYSILSGLGKLKGYKLYFKGKLGRKGSVKKSTIRFSNGFTSLTKKSLKFNYKTFLVYTETGVVGCYLSIFF